MSQLQPPPTVNDAGDDNPKRRLARLEALVRRIEDELADDELTDEQRLQNIGERVAGVMDGR